MPPELMKAFPERESKVAKFLPLFDGQVWKVDPTEYDYEPSETKAFVGALKNAAHKSGYYTRAWVTGNDHVIVQRRPLDYVPPPRWSSTEETCH